MKNHKLKAKAKRPNSYPPIFAPVTAIIPSLISNPDQSIHKTSIFLGTTTTTTSIMEEELWPWMNSLPSLMSSSNSDNSWRRSIVLAAIAEKSIIFKAERTTGSDAEALITFSICMNGFQYDNVNSGRTLWVSDPCSVFDPIPTLLFQLLREVIEMFPSPVSNSLCMIHPLESSAVSPAMAVVEEAPSFFCLALLCRLFWLCARDAPAEAGFLFFHHLNAAIVASLSCRKAAKAFLFAAGADWEERFMRALGYMLSKLCIIQELQKLSPQNLLASNYNNCCLSYAADVYGLWVLKGYAPVAAMACSGPTSPSNSSAAAVEAAKESVIRYALSHQQLESVVQLEYSVSAQDPRCIRVFVRVDNIRLHISQLGCSSTTTESVEANAVREEKHFPSRIQIWVGPQPGSSYAATLSLGRSTGNPERELETTRTMKGFFSAGLKPSAAAVKAKALSTGRSRTRSWRWEQDAEGVTAVYEGVLCDGSTGAEVVSWKPNNNTNSSISNHGLMRRRYSGNSRALSKGGGVVVAADELPETVAWRLGKEMEGTTVKWRVGAKVWVSYLPNELKSGYFETRCVEWREEVELPLVPTY